MKIFLFFVKTLIILYCFVSCSEDDLARDTDQPKLLNFELLAANNSHNLIEDASCTIIGDSVVDCWIQHVMEGKVLIPRFQINGEKLMIDNSIVVSDVTACDFKKPALLKVISGTKVKDYKVYVHSFTGIPVLWIETKDREDITSKDNYIEARFKLVEDAVTRAPGDIVECDGYIKGRGNSTWTMCPKKSYRLKYDTEVSFIDEPKDKSWVLLANYTDKTSLRNAVAMYMGSISNLDYTPHFHFVDVMLNGRYNGTYQLGDHIKISKNRVNVGKDGFLMEIDARAPNDSSSRWFNVMHLKNINIKEPKVEYNDEKFNYIKRFLTSADSALYDSGFTDTEKGWQKYMDMDSFVDWYLINEITKNNDACFFASCFMNLNQGGKLKMGPIWDFDIAIGNVDYSTCNVPTGFYIKDNTLWYRRLFQDPAFVSRVKERFDYFYDHQTDIMNNINQNANYLKRSVIENNNRWNTFYNYTWPNYDIWGNYMNEVQSMKTWIAKRFEWLKTQYDAM